MKKKLVKMLDTATTMGYEIEEIESKGLAEKFHLLQLQMDIVHIKAQLEILIYQEVYITSVHNSHYPKIQHS